MKNVKLLKAKFIKISMNLNLLVCLFAFSSIIVLGCNNSGKNQAKNEEKPLSNAPSSPTASGQQTNDYNLLLSQTLGTENLTNTCFANSVHKLIWGYLKEVKDKSHMPQSTKFQQSFYKFISDLDKKYDYLKNNSSQLMSVNKKDPFFATQLNNLFDDLIAELILKGGDGKLSGFSFRQDQMDAEEYFTKLIDLLNLNNVIPAFTISSQIELKNGMKLPVQAESTKPGGIPDDIIYFPLNIISKGDSFSQLFSKNLIAEIDDFDVAGVPQKVTKKTYFTLKDMNKIPNKIVLGLKRFSQDLNGNLSKNKDKFTLDYELYVDFYSMDLKNNKDIAYLIRGAVVHYGNDLKGGHYITYLKMDDHKWYKHNDSHISILETKAELLAMERDIEENGYLLLFMADM